MILQMERFGSYKQPRFATYVTRDIYNKFVDTKPDGLPVREFKTCTIDQGAHVIIAGKFAGYPLLADVTMLIDRYNPINISVAFLITKEYIERQAEEIQEAMKNQSFKDGGYVLYEVQKKNLWCYTEESLMSYINIL